MPFFFAVCALTIAFAFRISIYAVSPNMPAHTEKKTFVFHFILCVSSFFFDKVFRIFRGLFRLAATLAYVMCKWCLFMFQSKLFLSSWTAFCACLACRVHFFFFPLLRWCYLFYESLCVRMCAFFSSFTFWLLFCDSLNGVAKRIFEFSSKTGREWNPVSRQVNLCKSYRNLNIQFRWNALRNKFYAKDVRTKVFATHKIYWIWTVFFFSSLSLYLHCKHDRERERARTNAEWWKYVAKVTFRFFHCLFVCQEVKRRQGKSK